MGLVLSLFSAKVDISSRFGRLPAPVLWPETLMTCPSLDQRSVHGEMFIRHVRLGSCQHPLKKTTPRSLRSANAPYSCCTPRDSIPLRPSPSPQTTGTACCTVVARSACAHCAPNRKFATAATSTAAPGQSTDAPHRSTASRTSATSPSGSRPPSCGSVATDDPREHASLEKCN